MLCCESMNGRRKTKHGKKEQIKSNKRWKCGHRGESTHTRVTVCALNRNMTKNVYGTAKHWLEINCQKHWKNNNKRHMNKISHFKCVRTFDEKKKKKMSKEERILFCVLQKFPNVRLSIPWRNQLIAYAIRTGPIIMCTTKKKEQTSWLFLFLVCVRCTCLCIIVALHESQRRMHSTNMPQFHTLTAVGDKSFQHFINSFVITHTHTHVHYFRKLSMKQMKRQNLLKWTEEKWWPRTCKARRTEPKSFSFGFFLIKSFLLFWIERF